MDSSYKKRVPGFNELGFEGYPSLFSDFPNVRIRFESTTHYYHQKIAPSALLKINPEMKVMAMFRQPSDRLYSWYKFNLNHLATVDPSLKFNALVEALISGNFKSIDWAFRDDETHDFFRLGLDYGNYVNYFDNWKRLYHDNFRVFFLDDVKGRERDFISEICLWLGVDSGFYDKFDFASSNVAYETRSKAIHRLAVYLAKTIQGGGRLRNFLVNLYWSIQSELPSSKIDDHDEMALSLLDEYYAPSIERLANVVERPDLRQLWFRERRVG